MSGTRCFDALRLEAIRAVGVREGRALRFEVVGLEDGAAAVKVTGEEAIVDRLERVLYPDRAPDGPAPVGQFGEGIPIAGANDGGRPIEPATAAGSSSGGGSSSTPS